MLPPACVRPRRRRSSAWRCSRRARRRRCRRPTASSGASRRSSSRSSTRPTRSACSRRCSSPGASPTRSVAGRAARRARDADGRDGPVHGRRLGRLAVRGARLQGLATGLALGAASAALLDLHPRRDPAGGGLANGVASAAGMGSASSSSAAIVELLPAPRVLPYVLLFVLFAIALALAWRCPSRSTARGPPAADPAAPERARRVRRAVLPRRAGVLSSWSIGGLFLSLGPQLSASCSTATNHLVAGISVFVLAGVAARRAARVRPRAP